MPVPLGVPCVGVECLNDEVCGVQAEEVMCAGKKREMGGQNE
jgi:hypothetical protein